MRLFPDWRHHAFITNRDGDAVTLDAEHRAHAVVELAIRDLKHGAGLNHCPSGMFEANGIWLLAATLAHNLWRWVAALGIQTPGLTVAKTLRRRLLTIPGRITRSARRLTLHLPARWPWQGDFIAALTRIEPYPPPPDTGQTTTAASPRRRPRGERPHAHPPILLSPQRHNPVPRSHDTHSRPKPPPSDPAEALLNHLRREERWIQAF